MSVNKVVSVYLRESFWDMDHNEQAKFMLIASDFKLGRYEGESHEWIEYILCRDFNFRGQK